MKLLLHTCCAPCSVYCIDALRKENIEPTIYWFNPNIHPYMEYKARRNCLKEYANNIGVKAIFQENYGLKDFCKNVIDDLENRCKNYCYLVRLEQTAKYAKENGYDCFSTTLLVSPYQNHEAIVEVANRIAKKYEIEFLYRDFRVGFREGQAKARELGLYMQKYCGCIFSEQISNHSHILSDKKTAEIQNRETEKRIRLNRDVTSLEIKEYRNGNQEQIGFIYDLKKEIYKEYVEKIYGEWNEETQKKLFSKFMKENHKGIYLIYIKQELVGFYNGNLVSDTLYEIGNICIKPEFQNKGIGTAILKEVIFENKDKEIKLLLFKDNPAIKLYERLGFNKVDESQTHYIFMKVNNL